MLIGLAAFTALIGFGVASGDIQARSIYQEWQYNRLTKQLAGKTDPDSLHKTKVLAACDEFFGVQRPDDAFHCYESVYNDQKRKWAPYINLGTDRLNVLALSSANIIYDDDRVKMADIEMVCEKNAVNIYWVAYERNEVGPHNLQILLQGEPLENIDFVYSPITGSVGFATLENQQYFLEKVKRQRQLVLTYSNENGDNREFRFDVAKLPKKLSILREACGL
ncbi:MAG: hypothetical protein EX271_08355 [Acidimicrobiales bacterium]|nr:hypothetical protein [Hyphomonadaceae bacterium]RZV41284.1 MAG: hypothetical protein EX271_08355 [Acidimicrobiales bacterium]